LAVTRNALTFQLKNNALKKYYNNDDSYKQGLDVGALKITHSRALFFQKEIRVMV